MTTPAERRRNLIWGHETLAELAEDDALPPDWRSEAAALLAGYPSVERLQQVDDEGLGAIQEAFVKVLSEARWFFMRVSRHASSTEQRRYSLRVVLRHFL